MKRHAVLTAERPECRELLYRADIDGLRGIAVILVALYHAQCGFLPGGYIGVDVFFVISGYLITAIILTDLENKRFTFARFYERRARRLLPALYFYGASAAATAWFVLSPPAMKEFGRHLMGANSFSANIIYWLDASYFATKAEHLPLIHTWSLAVEEQFYLAFPALLISAFRFGSKPALFSVLIAAALSLAAAHYLSFFSTSRDGAFFLLLTRAWELLAGSLIAFNRKNDETETAWKRRTSTLLSFAGLVGILLAAITFDSKTHHPSMFTLIPVLGSCFVVAFSRRTSLTGRLLSTSPLLWVGLVSYSFYLAHQPMLAFTRIALARPLSSMEAVGVLLLAFVASALTFLFIEQPARYRQQFSTRSVALFSLGGATSLIFAGWAAWYFDGFPGRMEERVTIKFEQLEMGWKGRAEGIKLGRCHWNNNVAPDIDAFLARWNCLTDNSKRPRVLVVGDSISADKAWLLRAAGFDVGNLGGAGCPLLPPQSAQEPCFKILAKAKELVRSGGVDGVVLGLNWYGPVASADIDAMVEFWSKENVGLLVFSGMPVFHDFKNRVVKHIRDGTPLDQITFDDRQYELHFASLDAFQRRGVSVIDSRALLCGEKSKCGAYFDGLPLIGDPTHLQPAGVGLMAARLTNDPVWSRWYRSLVW